MNSYPPVKNKFDNIWIGAIIGLCAPLATLYAVYLVKYNYLTFSDFYHKILIENNILTPSISLCVISNLIIFFLFIWSNRNVTARGILMTTFVYLGYVVYQKYIR